MKVMTWEYASKNSMAEHVLRNLGDHECLVLETLQKKQQLFIWKADLLVARTQEFEGHEKSKSESSSSTQQEHRQDCRQTETSSSTNHMRLTVSASDSFSKRRVVKI